MFSYRTRLSSVGKREGVRRMNAMTMQVVLCCPIQAFWCRGQGWVGASNFCDLFRVSAKRSFQPWIGWLHDASRECLAPRSCTTIVSICEYQLFIQLVVDGTHPSTYTMSTKLFSHNGFYLSWHNPSNFVSSTPSSASSNRASRAA
eukprot:SAG31_NODE_4997_length_2813_cov_1.847826_2_plen_146_part_00